MMPQRYPNRTYGALVPASNDPSDDRMIYAPVFTKAPIIQGDSVLVPALTTLRQLSSDGTWMSHRSHRATVLAIRPGGEVHILIGSHHYWAKPNDLVLL